MSFLKKVIDPKDIFLIVTLLKGDRWFDSHRMSSNKVLVSKLYCSNILTKDCRKATGF